MAALILPSRRVVQPQGPVEVDWANPLTSALALDARGDQFFRDTAAGRIPTQSVGSFTRAATSYGVAANLASAVTSFGDVELSPANAQASFQIIEIPDNLTQVAGLLNKRTSATSQNSFSIGYNYVGTEFNVDLGNNAGTNISLSYRFNRSTFSTSGNNLVVIVDGAGVAGQRIRAYRNGALLPATASIDGATSSFANTTSPLEIGRVNNGTLYYAGKIVLVRSWNRVLEVAEVKALSENPWQTYRPIQRRIWVPVAGGGGISQTVAFTLEDVSAAVSQTAQHSQALSATLDDVAFAASQTVGNATNQTLAVTLDGVTVAAAQTLNHSQALAATLDGVTVAASQTLSHGQALAATLDGVTVAINQSAAPSQKDQALAITLDDIEFDVVQVGALPAVGGMGFVFTDTPSALWWKRKPKALSEEAAEQKVKRVVRVIKQIAAKQAPEQTKKQAQREVAQAIAPMLADMPGFDWTPLYRTIVAEFKRQREEAARIEAVAQIARIRAIEQDDEDILLLMI